MSGIDYGMGQTNIDPETGIRYGVIPAQEVDYWDEEGSVEPTCPKCGSANLDREDTNRVKKGYHDYLCNDCNEVFDDEQAYHEFPINWHLDDGEYLAEQASDSVDIFVTKSPFYTHAQLCSPCAPGACYLLSPEDDGEKAYCFGHDWFEGEIAPYRVYRVDDDSFVPPPERKRS